MKIVFIVIIACRQLQTEPDNKISGVVFGHSVVVRRSADIAQTLLVGVKPASIVSAVLVQRRTSDIYKWKGHRRTPAAVKRIVNAEIHRVVVVDYLRSILNSFAFLMGASEVLVGPEVSVVQRKLPAVVSAITEVKAGSSHVFNRNASLRIGIEGGYQAQCRAAKHMVKF